MTFVLCGFFLLYESIFSLNENKEKKYTTKMKKPNPPKKTQKLNPTVLFIPNTMHALECINGRGRRGLGGWVGNNVDNVCQSLF